MEGEEKEESADTLSMLMFENSTTTTLSSSPSSPFHPSLHLPLCLSIFLSIPHPLLRFHRCGTRKEGETGRKGRASGGEMRGKEGRVTGWSNVIAPPHPHSLSLFFPVVLFRLPTMSKNKGCKQRDTGGRMKIEEEGGSVFSIHLTMER